MTELQTVAPAFVEMAHRIVWASVATVDDAGRPTSRVLHPIWEWDGAELTGWIAVWASPLKRAHIAAHPQLSANYWHPDQDTCLADCEVEWVFDDAGRAALWERFATAPAPVGYDPAIIPQWADGPTSESFAGWRLRPYRLRVAPAAVLLGQAQPLSWRA
ncbi:pyridoxamine 5-phosphate oxidase [Mycolicibacterium brumae]|uniref:Pyridoxamine 5-phosphate oxidase n=1 Tax=Mycolicibacterium brumae TaxID=85968 RepID=A0A2G5PGU0_9MYCO|nr:pyridoxamine 5-phosphate oxidase [Mycolicibacterium brumae]MCV7192470.1 pyridoxamine 5'-phosphate oxidase family protein [Mycolicibacterium brumae]PIB77526.1 pyridoxamine 5-phosphate oxidase [Mycolicibacterium brumae]RWA18537.1 hypothetical protein MBRU_04780 [Mycolicibacterium brumae DSM 44177]UWW10238.1 pyridoxamine 5'-phosphate oxidase family protein [Mycolicibacterium brumae]